MKTLRTVFMGTPPFAATALEALIEAGLTPVSVVTQPAKATGRGLQLAASPVEQLAKQKGIPAIPAPNVNTPEIVEALKALQPDLFLVVAFGQLLKKSVLEIPKVFSLNVHGSLLPKYRGAAPIQRAILDGQSVTGITIQKMVSKMDAGDILLQKSTPIGPKETSRDLFERLAVMGAQSLVDAVKLIESGKWDLKPQIESESTLAPKITKEEAVIDWTRPAESISRLIRGLQPWPVAETKLGGVRLKIFDAEIVPDHTKGTPGTLSSDSKTQLVVTCGHSTALALTQIQLENRKKLEIRDFLTAYRGKFSFPNVG